ncbi:helix-turn-helix domain-containing protein [Solimicrobium silvestre]|nr:helix-turn-helix domain-containing protein [Solimicrobium silvestre]
MDNQKLIQTLINRRKELRLTQIQLAELAQISRRAIIDFESGKTSISLRRLTRILYALELTLTIKPGGSRPSEAELRELFKDDE